MSLLGKNIRLIGLSQKGKNRIREHGQIWTVIAMTDHILFAPADKGPWLFIAPVDSNNAYNDKATRWIKENNDVDFKVEIVPPG